MTQLKRQRQNEKNQKRGWLWWGVVVSWCAAIFVATQSTAFTADSTAIIAEKVLGIVPGQSDPANTEEVHMWNIVFRKSVHVIAFGLLAVFAYQALYPQRLAYVFAWAIAALYGAIDEWHQTFIPERDGQLGDVLLNAAGAALFLCMVYGWKRGQRLRQQRMQNGSR